MKRPALLLFPVLMSVPLLAQKVEIKLQDADQAQHFTIAAKFKTTETSKTLINGEEGGMGGGGRRGGAPGGGETTLEQQIEFVQGPTSDDYRDYKKLSAVESRPGRDGEARETRIEGGLQGKKVFLKSDGKGTVELVEGKGDTAKPVPAALTQGVPGRISFAGFAPAKAVEVGEEYALDKNFVSALRGVVHPVVADRGAQDAAGRAGRRQGGQGDQGGGRSNRGGAGFGGRGGAGSTVIQLLSSDKLDVIGHGKVIRVDSKDGEDIATIEVQAKLSGKGKAEDLGLQSMGAFGNRGGQAAGGDSTNDVDAAFDIEGKVTVNLTQHRVTAVALDGDLNIGRETKATMDRNGEETKIERTSKTTGKFSVQASCEAAGK